MTTRIDNVRVVSGGSVLIGRSVEWTGGRITRVGQPRGATEVIDGTGHTLLPGLVDAHTHVCGHAGNLELALAFGVTTELDMFDFPPESVAKVRVAASHPDHADVRSAGTLASATGGFPAVDMPWLPTLTGPEEADAFVEARAREGSDYLKIALTDDPPALDHKTVLALVDAARRHGLPTVAHTGGAATVALAVDCGIDVLSHVPLAEPLAPGLVARIADGGHAVVPTLAVLEMCVGDTGRALLDDQRIASRLPADARTALRNGRAGLPVTDPPKDTGLEHALATVHALHTAGVPVLAGSDASQAPGRDVPVVHGASLHRELDLLVAAGLDPLDAITAATSAPTAVFDLPDRGRVAEGMRADLLLVRGDPTRDITATRDIAAVWRDGVRVPAGERP